MLSFSSPGSPKISTGRLHAGKYQMMLQMICVLIAYMWFAGYHSLLRARKQACACTDSPCFFVWGQEGGGRGGVGVSYWGHAHPVCTKCCCACDVRTYDVTDDMYDVCPTDLRFSAEAAAAVCSVDMTPRWTWTNLQATLP